MPRAAQYNFQVLSEEIVRLARLLSRPGADHFRAARKEILKAIADNGQLAVPHLARTVGTSRQNIQLIIDRLKAEGCVEASNNPAHKRSPLYRLTPQGLEVLALASRAESQMFERLDLSEAQIQAALQVLSQISQHLGSSPVAVIRTPRVGVARRATPGPEPTALVPKPEGWIAEVEGNELPVNLL
jgi:DNA-binding MarR family transcriptional regulator